ncbi:MAG: cyclic lactone autoinducer peptide, partial [Clostridia bacterium]
INYCVNKSISRQYTFYYINLTKERGSPMLKLLAKVAEKYAKATNTACFFIGVLHQPKMPASLIKKD